MTKQYYETSKQLGNCTRCGKPNDRHPKIQCSSCVEYNLTQYYNKYRQRHLQYLRQDRLSIINKLGQSCSKCGFLDIRALNIDKIFGGHRKLMRLLGLSSPYEFYKYLSKLSDFELQKDWQVLCANCNQIKRGENQEYGN